jgi:hypothetical protein
MDSNNKQQNDTSEEMTNPPSFPDTPPSTEEILLVLSQRLVSLEERLLALENPRLMYKRPNSTEYEKISETLDYLHNNVEGLKKDLYRVATTR